MARMVNPVQAASEAIKTAIEQSRGPLPPPFVVQFLLEHWRRYLAYTYRDNGENSQPWKQAVKTTELLLWSVAPKHSPEERRELAMQLEPLLTSVKIGMAIAGTGDDVQNQFLHALSEWHVDIIARHGAPCDDANKAGDAETGVDLSDTLQLNVRDPRYRELMDLLDHAKLEQIDIDR